MAPRDRPKNFFAEKFPMVIVMTFGVAVMLIGMLIALVMSADHIAELMGWRTHNEWNPFGGSFFNIVGQIPNALYEGFVYFPESMFAAFIFYPLAVVGLAFYEATEGYYDMIMYGWAPFFAGVGIFLASGMMLEKTDVA